MWTGALLLLMLSIALAAERDENGPWCKNVTALESSMMSTCDVDSDSELSLQETSEVGRYRARLLVPANRCRVEKLRLTLYRYEFNQSQCSGQMNARESTIHSSQDFSCDEGEVLTSVDIPSDNPMPRINLTYYLDMVYGGCYVVRFDLTYNKTFTMLREQIVWISSNHTQLEFEERLSKPLFVTNVIGPSGMLNLVFQYRVPQNYVMEFFPNNPEENHLHKCSLEYKGSGSEISCKMMEHIKPGDYTIRYNARAGWCNGEFFYKYCFVNLDFTVVAPQDPHPPPIPTRDNSQDLLMILAIAIASLTVLMLILIVYYRFTKENILCERNKEYLHKSFNYVNVKEAKPDPCLDELKGILLVYARDCKPLMEAMAQLRRLLEEKCNVKVYDLLDESLVNEDICKSPQEWAVNMLKEPGIKVVLVKTPCGELLYDATIIGDRAAGLQMCDAALPSSVQYRESRFTDNLLHIMFRLVKDDAVLPGSYCKYFVVQITNFSGKKQLPQVNPYQRYELPDAIRLLVCDLINDRSKLDRNKLDHSLGPCEDGFRLSIQRLNEYVDNRDYITELLHIIP